MNLFSERLRYRKLTTEDFPVYLDMAMNAEVMKYITGKALTTRETAERFKLMTDTNSETSLTGFFMAFEKNSNLFIGLGKFVVVNNNTAEIGYSLLPQYWGKRYASEIAGFFISYASTLPSIENLLAIVNPDNIASKKLLARYGFTWLETGFVNALPAEIYRLDLQNKKQS